MDEQENNSPEQLHEEIGELIASLHSLQLATLDKAGEPCISYTPFLKLESDYFIFVSQLAAHTQNIFRHPNLSLLLIEDEFTAKNMFARKRLSLKCTAKEIENTASEWETILDAFESRHGNTVQLLRTLSDFHLFRLTPKSATFVKGFGQAFELSGKDLKSISHIKST